MTESSIYLLSSTPLIKGLARLLETIVNKGMRVHVFCQNQEEMKKLDADLWTFAQLSFLPHATEDDALQCEQPIILTVLPQNLNNASVLVANHTVPDFFGNYARFVSIYDTSENITAANQQIAKIKSHNMSLTVFEERNGKWECVVN